MCYSTDWDYWSQGNTHNFKYVGVTAVANVFENNIRALSEVSFVPYGFLMAIDSDPPDKRLVEITDFSKFDYAESRNFEIKLPTLPTHTIYPGDYRSLEEIEIDKLKANYHRI